MVHEIVRVVGTRGRGMRIMSTNVNEDEILDVVHSHMKLVKI